MSTALAAIGMALALAQPPAQRQLPRTTEECLNKAANPSEIARCEDRELRRLQNVVTQRYRQLIEAVKQHKTFGKDDQLLRKVEAEQKAWDRYATAFLAALYPVPESERVTVFGTQYLYDSLAARGLLLSLRVSALERLIHQYAD